MKKIRVLVVEDSEVIGQHLKMIINNDKRLEVAGLAASAEEALRLLPEMQPDVISLDIRLPGMNGLEATQRIMAEKPTPIVVCSGSIEKEDLKISINALKAGALTIVEKPAGSSHSDYEAMAEHLCNQLVSMSTVKLIRQLRRRPLSGFAPQPSHPAKPRRGPGWYKMVGIVTSTGGPGALVTLLAGLDKGFPLPILLVQHINGIFLEGFAAWLGTITALEVVLANDGEVPLPGKIYLSPGDYHLVLEGGKLRTKQTPNVSSQRPSGTVLFESMARELGQHGLGVLLTGMGEDGASGLLALRQAGGYTLAEDESTAVVFGMPKVAAQIGAACEVLPLEEIRPRILDLINLKQETV